MRPLPCGIALVFCLATAGCAQSVYHQPPGNAQPAMAQVAPDQRVLVWHDALAALLDAGYAPRTVDEASCYIRAVRKDGFGGDPNVISTQVLVSVAPDGWLRVEMGATGVYESGGDMDMGVRQRQDMLLQRILDRVNARTLASRL